MVFIKKPLTLLVGIIFSIILLSIIFPSDPSKPDLITRIKGTGKDIILRSDTVRSYRIGDIVKIDDSGKALIWSFNEIYLYYTKPADGEGQEIFEELWIGDIWGNKEKVLSKLKFRNIRDAKWSPDGSMLCFISNIDENKSGIFLYDTTEKAITDITPKNLSDEGVTSYGWDSESLHIIISVDIRKTGIEIYDVKARKASKLEMDLKACRNVDFYKDNLIIFSYMDIDSKYKIFTADRLGKNIEFVTEGQEFLVSPDKSRLSILSDSQGQRGLWIYNIENKVTNRISSSPIYNIYWLPNSMNLIYSMEEDCRSRYTYRGNLRYLEYDMNVIDVTGAVHTIFVPSVNGKKIAMTSPVTMEDKMENKGVFIGQLYK